MTTRKPERLLPPAIAKRPISKWYVPVGSSLHPAPRNLPLTMEQCGFLEMWHGKKKQAYLTEKNDKYEVVWATFDGRVLFIYNDKEEHYSRLFVTVSSITLVMQKDDSRFSVTTQGQELTFRSSTAEEHHKWVQILQQAIISDKLIGLPIFSKNTIKKSGSLVWKEQRSKVFVVVANDSTWLFNNKPDFDDGFGILSIAMNIARVKTGGRGTLEVITPYRKFCFSASTQREAEEWVSVMSRVADDSLCSDEVAKRIWSLPENQRCADCGCLQPEWVSVNLVAVVCSKCAGEHRSLGTNISNIKSLKMDSAIWTEPLIQLFMQVGNKGACKIWALNVPPSERINPWSSHEERQQFIFAKYRLGKFRRFHQLFGKQMHLNEALCQAVLSDDNISETMLLVFSGAQVTGSSGQLGQPTPIALAAKAGQPLQLEFLKQNEHKETPTPDPVVPLAVSTPPSTGKKVQGQRISQDLLPLQIVGNTLQFYDNHSEELTCSVELNDIFTVTVEKSPLGQWVEIWTPTDCHRCEASTPEKATLMYRFLAQALLPHGGDDPQVIEKSERMTQIKIMDEESETGQMAWALRRPKDIAIVRAALKQSCLFTAIQDISYDVEESKMRIQTKERSWELEFLSPKEFEHWCSVLCDITAPQASTCNKAGAKSKKHCSASDTILHCLEYLNQHALTTNGIYRQCSTKSRLEDLLAYLRKEAHKPSLKLTKYTEHEVAGALKHLLREMDPADLFTEEHLTQWMRATAVTEESDRIAVYSTLLDAIPIQNKLLLKDVFAHLHLVHLQSSVNNMPALNLSVVFAPTLFHSMSDLSVSTQLVNDFIVYHPAIFSVR
ncbi:arf-GAP with Rho-GAP domain, ANK repeat and PH domain-containing protein 1-like isoform X2 [Lissotriton helveticus]